SELQLNQRPPPGTNLNCCRRGRTLAMPENAHFVGSPGVVRTSGNRSLNGLTVMVPEEYRG
ncbi:unnamed protein product, partial [Amoebophrya sp. A120]